MVSTAKVQPPTVTSPTEWMASIVELDARGFDRDGAVRAEEEDDRHDLPDTVDVRGRAKLVDRGQKGRLREEIDQRAVEGAHDGSDLLVLELGIARRAEDAQPEAGLTGLQLGTGSGRGRPWFGRTQHCLKSSERARERRAGRFAPRRLFI